MAGCVARWLVVWLDGWCGWYRPCYLVVSCVARWLIWMVWTCYLGVGCVARWLVVWLDGWGGWYRPCYLVVDCVSKWFMWMVLACYLYRRSEGGRGRFHVLYPIGVWNLHDLIQKERESGGDFIFALVVYQFSYACIGGLPGTQFFNMLKNEFHGWFKRLLSGWFLRSSSRV